MGAAVQLGSHGLGAWRRKEIAPPGLFTFFLLFYQFYFLGQIFLHFVCEAINSHSRTCLALQGTLGSQESLFAPSQLCHCSLFLPPTLAIQRSPSTPSQTGFQELQERVQTSEIFEEDLALKVVPA